MELDISHLATFLVGAFSGAGGQYLGVKYTDKRRNAEGRNRAKAEFLKIKKAMPSLMTSMQDDLSNPEKALLREFILLPHRRIIFNGSKSRLGYYEENHPDLTAMAGVLQNHAYIIDVTTGDTPTFRMTEDFVACVLKH